MGPSCLLLKRIYNVRNGDYDVFLLVSCIIVHPCRHPSAAAAEAVVLHLSAQEVNH